jgi:outer membrane murein-binding lipoprotein Lpp
MEIAQVMEHIDVSIADLIQLLILLVAVVTVVNSYGSRIKALEKDVDKQSEKCAAAMESVVPKPVLNAKLEKLAGELAHLNDGQKALFKKVDDVFKLLMDYYAKGK